MAILISLDMIALCLAAGDGPELDDAELSRRIRNGDRGAFEHFYYRYQPALRQYLIRRNVPSDVADDIIQNAFVKIWEMRNDIDESRSLRSFLFRIGYSRAINHFRDRKKFIDSFDDIYQSQHRPDSAADGAAINEVFRQAVESLPERRRAVFDLCFIQGLTYREAAAILDISVKTVENQMGHALKAMRLALRRFYPEGKLR